MNELYEPCHCCMRNEAEMTVEFSTEALVRALKDIYNGFDVKDDIQNDAFMETLRLFNEATVQGLTAASYFDYDAEFLQQLKNNNAVFSAFRVHRMQNDIAAQLLDADGNLKRFEQWLNDIEGITDHYCRRWLQTEYNTAVIRAQQAADWKRFEANADVLPNLRWMPTTSASPDPYHKQYWQHKLTLPVNHPFWDQHRPGDRWNCKCSLQPTDDPVSGTDIGDFKPVPSVPGLDNNPGKDGKLFSDSHPYLREQHPGAKVAVSRKLRAYNKEVKEGITISTPYGKQVTEIIRKFEDEIRMNKDHEEAVAVDARGSLLFRRKGTIDEVKFSSEERDLLKDSILTHNHPWGWTCEKGTLGRHGSSFSDIDLFNAVKYDVAEIRAVTPTMTYSLKRPADGWRISQEKLKEVYEKCSEAVRNENKLKIKHNSLSTSVASLIERDEICRKTIEVIGRNWNYNKLKTRNDE